MSSTTSAPTTTSGTGSFTSVPRSSEASTRPSTTSTVNAPAPSTAPSTRSSTQATQGSHNSSAASSNPNVSTTSNASDPQSQSAPSAQEDYPEQRHAGAVGYGPNYRQGATLNDKISGLKEELKGKVTKNPDLVEHGKEKKTGELKKKELEEDMNNMDPFQTAEDDDQDKDEKGDQKEDEKRTESTSSVAHTDSKSNKSGTTHTLPSAPSNTQPNTSSAFGTSSTSAPPQPSQPVQTQSFGSKGRRDAQGHDLPTTNEGVGAPAGATESGSGMEKPRDVKEIDENTSRQEKL
ncbi:hypothetical protein FB446DRAFT_722223 [Lentinula raphanica]|nr:hypothetical protein FB446DRAFT_722223 [Lentinula raphanica]